MRRAKRADHCSMLTIVARSRCRTVVLPTTPPRAIFVKAVRSRHPPETPGISCACNEKSRSRRRVKRQVLRVRRLEEARGGTTMRRISRRRTRKRPPSRKIMLHKCPCFRRKGERQILNRTMPVRIAREVATILISCRR